jgi:hypothetical protein
MSAHGCCSTVCSVDAKHRTTSDGVVTASTPTPLSNQHTLWKRRGTRLLLAASPHALCCCIIIKSRCSVLQLTLLPHHRVTLLPAHHTMYFAPVADSLAADVAYSASQSFLRST